MINIETFAIEPEKVTKEPSSMTNIWGIRGKAQAILCHTQSLNAFDKIKKATMVAEEV